MVGIGRFEVGLELGSNSEQVRQLSGSNSRFDSVCYRTGCGHERGQKQMVEHNDRVARPTNGTNEQSVDVPMRRSMCLRVAYASQIEHLSTRIRVRRFDAEYSLKC